MRALGTAPGRATSPAAREDRDASSPLPDDVRCPCQDNQGGTAETMCFAPEPGGAFSFSGTASLSQAPKASAFGMRLSKNHFFWKRRCHAADWAHGRVAFAAASFAKKIAMQFCLQNPLRSKRPYAPILRTSKRNGFSNPKKSAHWPFDAFFYGPAHAGRILPTSCTIAIHTYQGRGACGPRECA